MIPRPNRCKLDEQCRILSIYIPESMYKKLDETGNKSEIVRNALTDYFNKIIDVDK